MRLRARVTARKRSRDTAASKPLFDTCGVRSSLTLGRQDKNVILVECFKHRAELRSNTGRQRPFASKSPHAERNFSNPSQSLQKPSIMMNDALIQE